MSRIQPRFTLTRRKRLLILLVVFAAVAALLGCTVFRDQIASTLRHITYSQKKDFPHNAQANSLFIGKENELLVCTQSQVQLFSPTGAVRVKEAVTMDSPALNVSGKYAVVFDVGGKVLMVLKGSEMTYKLEMPGELTILSATINEKGWVALTSKEGGYKGVVTVYDPSFEGVMSIRLSSRYVSDAVVTPDCRGVYIISPGQAEGAFENTLFYYTLSSRDAPTRELSLGSNVIRSIRCGKKCWIMGDRSLMILDSSCVITASYDYDGRYLKMGTLQGDDYAALFLSASDSGSGGTLITVDDEGVAYGELPFSGQTVALAAQNETIALLTTGDLFTTTRSLEEYTAEANQRGIRNVAVYADGSVATITSASVGLYFPGDIQHYDNPTLPVEEETEEQEPVQTEEFTAEEVVDEANPEEAFPEETAP